MWVTQEENMIATILDMPPSSSKVKLEQRLHCGKCGVIATAACDCGVAYIPARIAATKAIKAHPEKSNRAIAVQFGVGKDTIRRLRDATGANAPLQKRNGLDGRDRPAKGRQKPALEIVTKINTPESLTVYVTADDAELSRKQFLFAVVTRILDDLKVEHHLQLEFEGAT